MRRVIAAAMARSKREIPHYYLSTSIDMRRSLDWLGAENAKRPVTKRLLYSVLLIRAVALALRSTPELNGFWIDDGFQASEGIHIGVAISLRQGGLINPAIHDVDKKHLDELMENMLDLVNRARTGHLRSSELSDGTITVTNLGEQGVETVFGVIYPPQVALVGFGKITERAVASNGMVGVRPMIDATLAADHRVSDGHRAGTIFDRHRSIAARAGKAVSKYEELRIENRKLTDAENSLGAKRMTEVEIKQAVRDALSNVAPEVDIESIDPAKDLRDQIDIDSVDFLNFVIGLHKELNIDIPDADVAKLTTLNGCVAYLLAGMEKT